ncbi:MAG: helix-turn-helix transcriptional regulator [Gammaproteobacteria bacterium]|nr:helix-turn-helix transcriptional regulator [Gammaproteobacteria bacterium]
MTQDKWVVSSDNVFEDLGFEREEAAVLKIKADLMIEIEKAMKAQRLTQSRAAQILGVSRPRLNRMLHGRFEGVTIDRLVQMLERTGKHVSVKVGKKKAA